MTSAIAQVMHVDAVSAACNSWHVRTILKSYFQLKGLAIRIDRRFKSSALAI